ncbi:MAG: hypothetical protein P1R74_02485 [Sedimenticola sp.]|nr:hypothetical protein [Sedimenticola sp.]
MSCLRDLLLTAALFSLSTVYIQADQAGVILDNMITAPVESVPLKPTRFTLYDTRTITQIRTFHWNKGKGSLPGSIALQDKNKRLIGPWKATGIDDQGVANAYWEVSPDIVLEAGIYTVLDSEPSTWSRNPAKGDMGIVRVLGQMGDATADEVAKAENNAPAVASEPPSLTLEEQQTHAAELFEQIRQADTYDYAQIEQLYLQLLQECPDTEQAEESYFRLSNLYRMGMDPPEYQKLRVLLEEYMVRYPTSEMAPEMSKRLRRAYEDTGQWPQVVELYDAEVSELTEDNPYYLVTMLDYAKALEGSGIRDKALEVYRQVATTAGGEKAGNYDMSDLWLRVAQQRIEIIGLLNAENWNELVAVYRKQFSKMAFAEMPQIQELLEYAQALEKSGDQSGAIKQFRQVMRTDKGNQTLQGQQASARLIVLVGTDLYE